MIGKMIISCAIGLLISAGCLYFGVYERIFNKISGRQRQRGWYELSKNDLMPRRKRLYAIAKTYGISVRTVKGHIDTIEVIWGPFMARTEFLSMRVSDEDPKGLFVVCNEEQGKK